MSRSRRIRRRNLGNDTERLRGINEEYPYLPGQSSLEENVTHLDYAQKERVLGQQNSSSISANSFYELRPAEDPVNHSFKLTISLRYTPVDVDWRLDKTKSLERNWIRY